MTAVAIDPQARQVDPQFFAGMQVLSSSKNFPIKVAKETLKWIRTVTFISNEQLNRLADVSAQLSAVSKVFTRITIIPDTLSLLDDVVNLPANLSEGFNELDAEGQAIVFRVINVAKKIFIDCLGPLFRNVGFLVSDLLDLELVDLGEFLGVFKLSLGVLLVGLSVKEVADCYFEYARAENEAQLKSATLKLIEKGSNFIINGIYFTTISSVPTLAVTILLLSTTKLLAKIINEYLKTEQKAQRIPNDPELALDTSNTGFLNLPE